MNARGYPAIRYDTATELAKNGAVAAFRNLPAREVSVSLPNRAARNKRRRPTEAIQNGAEKRSTSVGMREGPGGCYGDQTMSMFGGNAAITAIVAMIASTLFYLLGDTAVKLASEAVPVPQIIVIRGLLTILMVASAAAAAGVLRYWRGMFTRPVLIRGGFDAVTTLMFTYALANMRIADATAVINAAPIAATLLAIVILKERVDGLRWMAVLLGFAGVVLVLRPDAGSFNMFGLLAVGSMIAVAGREVVTRRIAAEVPSLVVTLWSAITMTAAGAVAWAITGSASDLAYPEIGLIALSAVFLFGAYHYSVVSLRLGEVSMVGPFRYVIIIWGLVMGFVVWGDIPGIAELAGMTLITIAGFAVFRREFSRSRRERKA